MAKGHAKLRQIETDTVIMTGRKGGVINKAESDAHRQKVTQAVNSFIDKIKGLDISDETPVYRNFITELKDICKAGFKEIEQANVLKVLKSIKDPRCSVIRDPDTSPVAQVVESPVGPPEGQEVIHKVKGRWTNETREMVYETFECLAEAHDSASTACHRLARLSRSIQQEQFIEIAKIASKPFINLNILGNSDSNKGTTTGAVETYEQRVNSECVPPIGRQRWAQEKNPATVLLACVTYYVVRRGVLQLGTYDEAARGFGVTLSRLRSCVTAARYEGGPRVHVKQLKLQPGQVLGTAVKIETETTVIGDSSSTEEEGEKQTEIAEQDASVTTTRKSRKLSRQSKKDTSKSSKRKRSLISQELSRDDEDDNGDETKQRKRAK